MRQFKVTKSITPRSTESFARYLVDISKYKTISADEEVELAMKIKKGGIEGDRAKKELINANLRFVVSVAKQYKGKDSLEDLISAGNMGLIRAVDSYDPTTGFKFCSYAVWWIRQAITSFIGENNMIRKPANFNAVLRAYQDYDNKKLMDEGNHASVDEFLDTLEVKEPTTAKEKERAENIRNKRKETILQNLYPVASVDKPLSSDSEDRLIDVLSSDSKTDITIDAEDRHHDLLRIIYKVLTPREAYVLLNFYGIGIQETSLEQIASEQNLTRERARQIREHAQCKLRESRYRTVLKQYL